MAMIYPKIIRYIGILVGMGCVVLLMPGCQSFFPKVPQSATYDFGALPTKELQSAPEGTARSDLSRSNVSTDSLRRKSLHLSRLDVTAPTWLSSPNVYYRLAYQNPHQLAPYQSSRWVMTFPRLIEARLKQMLPSKGIILGGSVSALDTPAWVLLIDLDEATHVLSHPLVPNKETAEVAGQGVVRLRASVLQKERLLNQRSFECISSAPSPDGNGAVLGLRSASDQCLEAVLTWLLGL